MGAEMRHYEELLIGVKLRSGQDAMYTLHGTLYFNYIDTSNFRDIDILL